jgi:CBS domain-containing protein
LHFPLVKPWPCLIRARLASRATSAAVLSPFGRSDRVTTTTKENAMNTPILHKNPTRPFELLRAKDLMKPNPVSIRRDVGIREALEVLTDRGFGAAPVIDEAGRPIGVVSRTDILIHERENARYARVPDWTGSIRDESDWDLFPDPWGSRESSMGGSDATTVGEIMTPAVFTVALDTPARAVVRHLLELKVHHLFVSDGESALVGVISPLDVMRHLAD